MGPWPARRAGAVERYAVRARSAPRRVLRGGLIQFPERSLHFDHAALLATSPGHANHDLRLLLLAWAADVARGARAGALARPATGVVALRYLPAGVVDTLRALAEAVAADLGRPGDNTGHVASAPPSDRSLVPT